jgi:hypothetical protein
MADFFDEGPFFVLGKMSNLDSRCTFLSLDRNPAATQQVRGHAEQHDTAGQKKGQGRKKRSFPVHSQSTSDLRSRCTAGWLVRYSEGD